MMKNKKEIVEQLNALSKGKESKWIKDADWRIENQEWLKKSQAIALKILRTLRTNKANNIAPSSQAQLAEKIGVSAQQVNKWVKGKENFTLETICKLEKALKIDLIEVPTSQIGFESMFQSFQSLIIETWSKSSGFLQANSSEIYYSTQKSSSKVVKMTNNSTWTKPRETVSNKIAKLA